MSKEFIVSLIGLSLTVLGLLYGYFKFILGIFTRLTAIETFEKDCNIRSLNVSFAKWEGQMEMFFTPLVKALVLQVKQPIHLRKDELLDKLAETPKEMSDEELIELREILEEESNGKPKEENFKYAFLKGRIDWILCDRR